MGYRRHRLREVEGCHLEEVVDHRLQEEGHHLVEEVSHLEGEACLA